MVQRKGAQKTKSTPIATSSRIVKKAVKSTVAATSSKAGKKIGKSKNLTNGYETKQSPNTETTKQSDIVEPSEPAADVDKTSSEISTESVKTESSEDAPSNSKTSESVKPGTSSEHNAMENEDQTANEKPEVKKNIEIVSQPSKSRKRKATSKKEKIKPADKTSSVNKTKAKKQKIVLEVPSLRSLPGKVFVVGENDVGQLGLDEDVDCKERPFLLELPHSIVDVAAGGMHSVCLAENGEVFTFGCNDEGALGRVTTEEEERIPQKVDIPEKIIQVSAGDSHSAALAESGQVYIWGNFRNGEGQMGLTPDGKKRIVPLKVLNDITIVKIASGGDHLVCLSNDGIVYTCGCGEQGQLGRINPRSCRDGGRKGLAALLEPAAVDRLMPRIAIDDVWTESYATFLKAQDTGSIYAFGLNNYNQLGLENKNSDQQSQMKFFPETVSSFNGKNWLQINGGQHHTLALDSNGFVYALGRKDYGRLGLGQNCEDTTVPTVVPTLQKEKCNSVSCGNCVSFAVTEQGSVYSWGMGSSQLGQGEDEDIHAPRLISGKFLNSWQVHKVSGGGQHALILACPKASTAKNKKA